MRCIRIEFAGFKRLANTSCNTDGKVIAFLGPNEAGKSSVLQGLEWLSHGDGPLPGRLRNRSQEIYSSEAVVRARFALSDEDRATLADVPHVGEPRTFVLSRYPDGHIKAGLDPALKRDPEIFDAASAALSATMSDFKDYLLPSPGDPDGEARPMSVLAARVEAAIADTDAQWDSDLDDDFEEFCEWLREPVSLDEDSEEVATGTSRAADCAQALEEARDVLRQPHPQDVARSRFAGRAPKFVLFSQEDRDLGSSYDIEDEDVRSSPPRALANLLRIAELNLQELWTHMEDGNTGKVRTIERRANERLQRRLGPKWRQEGIDVVLNLDGTILEVLVVEKSEGGADTPIGERSDGLRMFVALVAFLARHDFDTPPILLVDEAETHLHYDAQADLVEVLANDVEATQVFYTTHSPGCLPRDLGTGIRLVAPEAGRRDSSQLRNDFWTNERPGFTPLLFAMGASAAAFSAFRRAVLAEGAADMILLPSLMRHATGLRDLPYQVAPGLANHHGSGLDFEDTAARVVYLLDGDAGGADHRARLTSMGIDDSRIFSFEPGKATEDYVHPDRYLEVVGKLLASTGVHTVPALEDLASDMPISKAVADWCKASGVRVPSKPAVASVLVGEPDRLRLAANAEEALSGIHDRLMAALERKELSRV